jgi:hypothetical protein
MAIGGDDVDGQQVVAGEAVGTGEPAHAAAEREAGDAGMSDDARGRGQARHLCGAVQLAERGTTFHSDRPVVSVDRDAAHS